MYPHNLTPLYGAYFGSMDYQIFTVKIWKILKNGKIWKIGKKWKMQYNEKIDKKYCLFYCVRGCKHRLPPKVVKVLKVVKPHESREALKVVNHGAT